MFSTSFGGKGGYQRYAAQQNRMDAAAAQQQKSARISAATKGKKKKRKPESKGKHRQRSGGEITIRKGSEKQGGTGYGTVNVIAPRRPNRAGAGRPVSTSLTRGISTAFDYGKKEARARLTQEERIAEAVARAVRPAGAAAPRAPPPPNQPRRDADARAEARRREVAARQEREDRLARERDDRALQARRVDIEQAREERLAAGAPAHDDVIARIDALAAQVNAAPPPVYNAPVYNPPVYHPPPAPAPITITNNPNIQLENIGNPVVNLGSDATSRRRERRRRRGGGGGGGRRPPPADTSSSGGSSGPDQPAAPSPRTRRESVGGAATRRQTGRTPAPEAPTAAEEAEMLERTGGGVVVKSIPEGQPEYHRPPRTPAPEESPKKEKRPPLTQREGEQQMILESIQQAPKSLLADALKPAPEPEPEPKPRTPAAAGPRLRLTGRSPLQSPPTSPPQSSGEEGKGGESDTSFKRIYLGMGGVESDTDPEQELFSVSDVESGKQQVKEVLPLPTQEEQRADPFSFLDVFQQTGGDVAVEPFEEPSEPQRPVLKLPQPPSDPESSGEEGEKTFKSAKGESGEEEVSSGELQGEFSGLEESEQSALEEIPPERLRRGGGRGAYQYSSPEDTSGSSGETLGSSEAEREKRRIAPIITAQELIEKAEGVNLASDAINVPTSPTGSLSREEKAGAYRGSSYSESEGLSSSGEELRKGQEREAERARRKERKPRRAPKSHLQIRRANLGQKLTEAEVLLSQKEGKQGEKTLSTQVEQMREDLGLIDRALERELESGIKSKLQPQKSEAEGYGKGGGRTQGGSRGGGRRALAETPANVIEIQQRIRDNVILLRATKQITEPQITKKNREAYRKSLIGLIDLHEIERIMALYDATLAEKQELRRVRKNE